MRSRNPIYPLPKAFSVHINGDHDHVSRYKSYSQCIYMYKLPRAEARQIKPKEQANDRILFGRTYNPMLSNMRILIKKYLPVLHSDSDLKNIYLENSICMVFKKMKS